MANRIINVLLIITAAVVCTHAGIRLYRAAVARSFVESPYRAGEVIHDTIQLGFQKSPSTIVLFTRSTCKFCTASMEFYRTLVEKAQLVETRVVAVTTEDPGINRAYLSSNGVNVDEVASSNRNGLRALATPTILLVRSNGIVAKVWRGKLSQELEQEVLAAVNLTRNAAN